MAVVDRLDREMGGLDQLELTLPAGPSVARRVWSAAWPKVAAVVIGIGLWQLIVWVHWKPTYLLPGPFTVLRHAWDDRHDVLSGTGTTLRQAVEYYLVALGAGTVIAVVVTRINAVRLAVTPLVTGLQTMPSVAWVPIAILLFGVRSEAVLFVTLAGSIPAVVVGAVAAIDAIPPILLRVGDVLGARGVDRYRHVVLPAAMPGYVAGMRQAWAFAWRSLMAGELIVASHGSSSLGQLLSAYQDQSLSADVLAVMVAILAVGLLVDVVIFSRLERTVLQRRGLLGAN